MLDEGVLNLHGMFGWRSVIWPLIEYISELGAYGGCERVLGGSTMSGFVFDGLSFRGVLYRLVLPFVVTLFFLQGFRTFVVDVYIALFNILWEGTGEYLPLLGFLVFAMPLVAVLLRRLVSLRVLVGGSAVGVAVCTVPLSLLLPYEIELLLASLVIAGYSVFLPLYLCQQRQALSEFGSSGGAALLAVSMVLAFSYDLLFRTVGVTYDLSRTLLFLPVQLGFTITIIGLVVWNRFSSRPATNSAHNAAETERAGKSLGSTVAGVFTMAGFGFLLFLQQGLLLNPHNLLRWAYPVYFLFDVTIALSLTFLIIVFAALILAHNKSRTSLQRVPWYWLAIANLVLTVFVAFVFLSGGWLDVIGVIGCQLVLILNLFFLLQLSLHPSVRWSATTLLVAMFLALLMFLLWDVMFAFTFAHAYLGDIGSIFAGHAITVVVSAAVLLGICSVAAGYKLRRLE